MGDCKDQLKSAPAPAAAATPAKTSDKILGIFSGKRGDSRVKELEKKIEELTQQLDEARKPTANAQTFADHVQAAIPVLDRLIKSKSDDCKNEKGKEHENETKLGMLETMRYLMGGVETTIDRWNDKYGDRN